jgi:hypothetical protein
LTNIADLLNYSSPVISCFAALWGYLERKPP